jgi:hypothetical protein
MPRNIFYPAYLRCRKVPGRVVSLRRFRLGGLRMEASNEGKTRNCVSCGRAIAWDANVCQYCGHDFRAPAAAPPHEKTVLSIVGGILILIAGIMGLAMGAIFIVASDNVDTLTDWGVDVAGVGDMVSDILLACGIIVIVLAIIVLLGGFFGVMRKHWGLVILGGVLGLLLIGPYMLASIFSLIGLILVAVSKKDFD